MSSYLPIIISAVLIVAILLWWLLALDGVKKTDAAPKDTISPPAPPVAVPAPPVTPPVTPVAKSAVPPKLMDDPAPATNTAKAKVQAPLKAAATKKAPVAKPAAPKAPVAKVAAPKVKAAKPAPVSSIPDNLELIKGLGPKVNKLLNDFGVTSFTQVAGWTAADVAEMDSKLGAFAGRITRDNWIEQAKLLAAGDVAGFEAKYGKLGSEAKG